MIGNNIKGFLQLKKKLGLGSMAHHEKNHIAVVSKQKQYVRMGQLLMLGSCTGPIFIKLLISRKKLAKHNQAMLSKSW